MKGQSRYVSQSDKTFQKFHERNEISWESETLHHFSLIILTVVTVTWKKWDIKNSKGENKRKNV